MRTTDRIGGRLIMNSAHVAGLLLDSRDIADAHFQRRPEWKRGMTRFLILWFDDLATAIMIG